MDKAIGAIISIIFGIILLIKGNIDLSKGNTYTAYVEFGIAVFLVICLIVAAVNAGRR